MTQLSPRGQLREDEEKLPLIDLNELDDQHHKAYLSKSLKEVVRRFARENACTESEATRRMLMVAAKSPEIFGGYRVKAHNARGYVVHR